MMLNGCLRALNSIIWKDQYERIETELRFSHSKYWRLFLMDEVIIPVFIDDTRKLSDIFGQERREYMLLGDIVNLIERRMNIKVYPPPKERVRDIDGSQIRVRNIEKSQVRRDVGIPMCVLKLLQGNRAKRGKKFIQVYVKGPLLNRCNNDERCKELVRKLLRKIIVLEKIWHLKLYDCSFLLDVEEKANIRKTIEKLAKEIGGSELTQLRNVEWQLCDAKIKFCEFIRNLFPDTVIGRR